MQSIAVNLERVRWLPQSWDSTYLVVDIPLMELFLRRNGANAMHMRVVVGKPARQTPSLGAPMANVVLNPPWGVPPTILKKDVLPGIQRSGNAYLSRKGLKAYDRHGDVINAGSINAKNYKSFTFRQAPGDDNALGVVKFNLPNPWNIYLHDTPHKGDFPNRNRAKSSGCIRVQEPREMAYYILNDMEGKDYPQTKMDSIIETHKTLFVPLKNKIPVHIVYLTAFEDTTGNNLHFLQDIYKKDKAISDRLNALN